MNGGVCVVGFLAVWPVRLWCVLRLEPFALCFGHVLGLWVCFSLCGVVLSRYMFFGCGAGECAAVCLMLEPCMLHALAVSFGFG